MVIAGIVDFDYCNPSVVYGAHPQAATVLGWFCDGDDSGDQLVFTHRDGCATQPNVGVVLMVCVNTINLLEIE